MCTWNSLLQQTNTHTQNVEYCRVWSAVVGFYVWWSNASHREALHFLSLSCCFPPLFFCSLVSSFLLLSYFLTISVYFFSFLSYFAATPLLFLHLFPLLIILPVLLLAFALFFHLFTSPLLLLLPYFPFLLQVLNLVFFSFYSISPPSSTIFLTFSVFIHLFTPTSPLLSSLPIFFTSFHTIVHAALALWILLFSSLLFVSSVSPFLHPLKSHTCAHVCILSVSHTHTHIKCEVMQILLLHYTHTEFLTSKHDECVTSAPSPLGA